LGENAALAALDGVPDVGGGPVRGSAVRPPGRRLIGSNGFGLAKPLCAVPAAAVVAVPPWLGATLLPVIAGSSPGGYWCLFRDLRASSAATRPGRSSSH
jgi:hypothetical protein